MSSITVENLLQHVHINNNETMKTLTRNEKDIYFHLLVFTHLFNPNMKQTDDNNLLISTKILCETLANINENKEKTNIKTLLFAEIKKMTTEKKTKKNEIPEQIQPDNVIKSIVDNYYDETKKNDINNNITQQILSAVLSNKKNAKEKVDEKKDDEKKVVIKIKKKIILKKEVENVESGSAENVE